MICSYARLLADAKKERAMILDPAICTCGHSEQDHDFQRREPCCFAAECECERFHDVEEETDDD